MRYTAAHIQRHALDTAYRVYVTDALKMAAENTSRLGGGSYMKARYWDVLHPAPEDTRTEEDIKAQVFGRLEELRKGGE